MTEKQILVVCDNIAEAENHILQLISKAGELAAQNECEVCVICPPNWKYEERNPPNPCREKRIVYPSLFL